MAMRRKRKKRKRSICNRRRSSLLVKNSRSIINRNFTFNNNSNVMFTKLQPTMKKRKKTKKLSTLIMLLWSLLRQVRLKREISIIILKIKTSMRCSRSRKIWIPRSLI